MPQRRLMPDVVHDQELSVLGPQALVNIAVKRMVERNISAIVITADGTRNGKILGIFTERDLLHVVHAGREPRRTHLDEVMTHNPDTLPAEATALDALHFMRKRNYRHLPVAQDGRMVGMVSIRDLFVVATEQLVQDVHECEAIVFGSGYSVDTIEDRRH